MSTEVQAESSAPEAATHDDLVGMFAAEIAAEREPAAAPAAPEPKEQPAAPIEEAAAEPDPVEPTGEPPAAEPESEPTQVPATTVPDAPKGLTEAERAVFAQLPPELKAFLTKRDTETNADYTRKTQAVAEARKAADAQTSQLAGELQRYSQILQTITAPQLVPPDPAMANSDPLRFQQAMAQYTQDKYLQETAAKEQADAQNKLHQLTQQQRTQFYQAEAEALAVLDPELADREKGAPLRKAVFEYASKSGYSPEQLTMASARDLVTLRKAMAYDAAQAAKAKATIVQSTPPKAMRPAPSRSGRPSGLATAISNLSSNPGRDALAAAFAAEIAAERK